MTAPDESNQPPMPSDSFTLAARVAVKVLRSAGWSYRRIADTIGTASYETIRRIDTDPTAVAGVAAGVCEDLINLAKIHKSIV